MLFPAILLYLIYLVLLNAARGAIEEERLSSFVGLWSIHIVFLLLGLVFLLDKQRLGKVVHSLMNKEAK